jgi:hypothetical protein
MFSGWVLGVLGVEWTFSGSGKSGQIEGFARE